MYRVMGIRPSGRVLWVADNADRVEWTWSYKAAAEYSLLADARRDAATIAAEQPDMHVQVITQA